MSQSLALIKTFLSKETKVTASSPKLTTLAIRRNWEVKVLQPLSNTQQIYVFMSKLRLCTNEGRGDDQTIRISAHGRYKHWNAWVKILFRAINIYLNRTLRDVLREYPLDSYGIDVLIYNSVVFCFHDTASLHSSGCNIFHNSTSAPQKSNNKWLLLN